MHIHVYIAIANTQSTVSIDLTPTNKKFPSVIKIFNTTDRSDKNPND
jgi:hypothetical protein